MLRILCCVALISLTVAGKINFKDCNNGEVKEFRIENCDGKNCTIKQGGHFLFGLDYVANQDTEVGEFYFYVKWGPTWLEMPLMENELCNIVKPSCPMKKGVRYTFDLQGYIEARIPAGEHEIMFMSNGDNGRLVCAQSSTKLVE